MKEGVNKVEELLKLENIFIIDGVSDWKEAVHVGVKPLEEGGYVEKRYADEIIKNTEKFGPYYVLTENLALLHASHDQGVRKKQIAITVMKHPIKFKEDGWDVRILLALAAEDSDSHMKAMQVVSNIFVDLDKISTIVNAATPKDIYDVFMSSTES